MAVGKEKLISIYKQTHNKKEFVEVCSKKYPTLKKSYTSQVWYKFKNEFEQKPTIHRGSPTKTTQNDVVPDDVDSSNDDVDSGVGNNDNNALDESPSDKIQTLDANDVNVTEGESVENKDLREVYGNMFNEDGDDESSDDEDFDSYETSQTKNTKSQKSVDISPARLLSYIAVSINNNLLYGNVKLVGDRLLSDDERNTIDEFSIGVAKKDLKLLEDQPEINWALASFIVPAMNRIDLYIEKLVDISKKRAVTKRPKQSEDMKDQQQEVSQPQTNYNNEQKQTIQAWIQQGFKVDDNFDFTQPIDIVAYRDNKIIKNM